MTASRQYGTLQRKLLQRLLVTLLYLFILVSVKCFVFTLLLSLYFLPMEVFELKNTLSVVLISFVSSWCTVIYPLPSPCSRPTSVPICYLPTPVLYYVVFSVFSHVAEFFFSMCFPIFIFTDLEWHHPSESWKREHLLFVFESFLSNLINWFFVYPRQVCRRSAVNVLFAVSGSHLRTPPPNDGSCHFTPKRTPHCYI